MISRCPSCGAPAPDEARLCRACGWDFVANKKSDKKPDADKKPEAPAPKQPPPSPAGFSLPPARGGDAAPPPAKPAKPASGAFAAPPGDENPFALPVARNLGPKPGESLFAAPPVSPPAAKLPEAKPKQEDEEVPVKEEPPKKPAPKKEEPLPEPPEDVLPKGESLPAAPAPAEPEPLEIDAEEPPPASALFLPTSTKEIVVEAAKRAPSPGEAPPAPEPEPVPESDIAARLRAKKDGTPAPKTAGAAPAKDGRRSAVYLAAAAGAALGLLSVSALYMMTRQDTQAAARPTGASPFGKRGAGEATVTPVLDAPETPSAPPPESPAPKIGGDAPSPTSIPAPAMSRPIEPPMPGATAAVPAPVPAPAPAPAPAPVIPAPAPPAPVAAPVPAPVSTSSRPTATFAQAPRPKAPSAAVKAKAAAALTAAAVAAKPKAPQWVFEGTVYDLISTRGVFGVKLVFVDGDDNEVGSVETGPAGRFKISLRAGPPEGYQLHIIHDDYTGKHIDELDSTSSLRKADLEQRKFLMQAGARSLPWIGTVGKPVKRDMALVPRVAPE